MAGGEGVGGSRSYYRTGGESTGSVEFREHGSRYIHRGEDVHFHADGILFESDYGVAPGAWLNLRVRPDSGDIEPLEAEMEVVRVDSRPGNRFRIAGRLRRNGV